MNLSLSLSLYIYIYQSRVGIFSHCHPCHGPNPIQGLVVVKIRPEELHPCLLGRRNPEGLAKTGNGKEGYTMDHKNLVTCIL